jgi:ribosome biogenesis GTPase / thiamine phosphate phosphatase
VSPVKKEIALDTLESLGWGPAWAMKFEPFAEAGLCPGRVFAEQREIYHVQSQHGEAPARVSGRMRHEARERAAFPAVGDWVAIDATGGDGHSVIHALVPRFNRFSRKLAGKETDEQIVAANLDTLFLVTSLNRELKPTPDRTLHHSLVGTTGRGLRPSQQARLMRMP